jgi:hypothetical protein
MAAPVDPTNESKTYKMVGFFFGAYHMDHMYIYIYIHIDIDRGMVETWGFQFDDKHVGQGLLGDFVGDIFAEDF